MINKLFSVVKHVFFRKKEIKYTIGNIKKHNTHVDTLIPQYVTIGDNFISAPGSYILSHDASTFLFSGKYRVEKTTIGNNVFLGAGSIILPGVKVGDNVIIGAGTVVSKDIAANQVVAGNPCRVISTVDEYIDRCERRNCLISPPEEFDKIYDGVPINADLVLKFQKKILRNG